jgi:IS5 family transposase
VPSKRPGLRQADSSNERRIADVRFADRFGQRRQRGIKDRIARKGIERNDRLGRHRWVVERTHAWLAAFGKLRVRFERRIDSHLAFLSLACCVICLRTLMRFC